MDFEYTFIRSRRRTIGITIKQDGSVVLRAPMRCSRAEAESFLFSKMDWINKTRKKIAEKAPAAEMPKFSDAEVARFKAEAKKVIPGIVKEVAAKMGVTYGTVSIRAQKTRWGSCSVKGNLNFNCLLVLLPENVLRYVVVHELAHRRHMNHSAAFWREVEKYQPTYREDRAQLKAEGSGLIERLP